MFVLVRSLWDQAARWYLVPGFGTCSCGVCTHKRFDHLFAKVKVRMSCSA